MVQLALSGSAEAAKLPTSLTSRHHEIHRWFNFIAGFSPEFVASCINNASGVRDGYVLDPFAGAGTTLVEAQLAGLPTVGYEPHPFFAEMARAKLDHELSTDDVNMVEALVAESFSRGVDPSTVWTETPLTFLRKLIPEPALTQLAASPELVEALPERLQPIFRLIVSRTLEGTSGSKTDGVYKAPTSAKRSLEPRGVLASVCAELRHDLEVAGDRTVATLVARPAGDGIADGASLCVTSPPYLNNFDFAEMTRMELYFWRFAGSWREITETVRSQLLVNTTTAPSYLRCDAAKFRASVDDDVFAFSEALYSELATVCNGRSKPYHQLVYPYTGGLSEIFAQVYGSLQADAPIHVVVADSALYGVHIRLHDLVALILAGLGFREVAIRHLRERGERWVLAKRKGPPGKLGEYWVSAKR
jgi:hypothetical protein